jgi:hypothetical protein
VPSGAAASGAAAGGIFHRGDPRRLQGWAQALLILLASRVLVTFVVIRSARLAPVRPGRARLGYWDLANCWDGSWYQRTVDRGYPAQLPLDAFGAVEPNAWAFYPLFPRVTRLVAQLTELTWTPAATLVTVSCAAGAVVVMRSLLVPLVGPQLALWTVALFCFFPSAPVLQLPYAESPAILLLVTAFWLLQRRQYGWVVPVLLLIGLARPIAVPMALVLTVHLVLDLRTTRNLRCSSGPLTAWLASGVAVVEWPLVAWHGTGVPDAYTRTMAGWRTPHEVVPLRPWLTFSEQMLGQVVGPLLLLAAVALFGWWLARPGAAIIGTELRVWCGAYLLYLLAVLDSFTSLPRYLLPLFPLGTLLAAHSSSRAFRFALTATGAVLTVIWILEIWRTSTLAP